MTTNSRVTTHYADVISLVEALGIAVPPDVHERVSSLTGLSLRDAGVATTEVELVQGWCAFLDSRLDDPLARLVVLLLFERCIDPADASWFAVDMALQQRQTLAGRPMRAAGTRFEIKKRLAGQFYDVARRGKTSDANRTLLREAVNRFDELIATDGVAIAPRTRIKYFGMRGVAHLLLARGSAEAARYDLACADLEETRLLGDRSVEHEQYLVESYLHRLDAIGEPAFLDRAGAIVEEALEQHANARGLLTQKGEVLFRRGVRLPKTGDAAEDAADLFSQAVDAFDRALRAAPHQSFSDDYIRMKRGMARFRRFLAMSKMGDTDPATLDDVILDIDRYNDRGESLDSGLTLPWAFVLRAQAYSTRGEFSGAVADLERALSLGMALRPGRLKDELCAAVHLRLAAARVDAVTTTDDFSAITRCVAEALAEFEPTPWLVGPLTRAGRALLKHTPQDVALILEIARFAESVAADSSLDENARAFAAAHGASLLHLVARSTPNDVLLRRAHRLFSEALSHAQKAPPEWWTFAGEVALRIAKRLLARGDDAGALSYLEDARAWFSSGIALARNTEEGSEFRFREALSKLGEACLRLHAISAADEHGVEAIAALRESIALGNNTPHVFGLLADVYYRRGRANGSLDDLREARALKERARETPAEPGSEVTTWRENLSVSAAISTRIFRITRELDDLRDAVQKAVEAAHADKSWPWPLFQLADLAQDATALPDGGDDELVRTVLRGDAEALNRRACNVAIQNRLHFEQKILGGRQKVYVLRDPHRLLSESYVFKPSTQSGAEREMTAIASFQDFLTRAGAPRAFRLPSPLMVVPGAEAPAVTYVMRKSEGLQLGMQVLRSMRGHSVPSQLIETVVSYLAHYHAWTPPADGETRAALNTPLRTIRRYWNAAFGPETAREFVTRLRDALPETLPLVAKKDAHPENWLVTSRGDVVMLDLEAATRLPLMFELAQLLDDYPFFACTDEGWQRRYAMIDAYLAVLRRLSRVVLPPLAACRAAYDAFALMRAALGIGHERRPQAGSFSSSSVLRAVSARRDHYFSIAQYLAMHSGSTRTRAAADFIVQAAVTQIREPARSSDSKPQDALSAWLSSGE